MTWPEPIGEPQSSIDDTWACSNFSTSHSIESQIKFYTGKTVNLSERFLAIMSGTIPGQGNYLSKVFATVEKYGWLEDDDCPQPQGAWTNAEYYSFPITPELLTKALKNKEDWKLDYILSKPASQMLPLLKNAPLIAFVPQGDPNHFIEVLDEYTIFDSYIPYIKPLGLVQNYSQIIIKKKDNMQLTKQMGTSTYYLVGKKNGQEVKAGINGVEFLNLMLSLTDEVPEQDLSAISQVQVIETASNTFVVKPK